MNSIVLASSKGVGKSIADKLESFGEVVRTSTKELDTSDIDQVRRFVEKHQSTDILVLNTGGPPAKDFWEITDDEWFKYFNQLFFSFVYILKNLKIQDNGYIFLISSTQIKEPNEKMALSTTFRLATAGLLKILSKKFAKKNINCINIALGPIATDRLFSLVDDIEKLESEIPIGRLGKVDEISDFVYSIVKNNIKYLNGVTINFDGGISKYVL